MSKICGSHVHLFRRPRTRRSVLRSAVLALVALYAVSSIGVFWLESQFRQRSFVDNSPTTRSSASILSNDSEHRKRFFHSTNQKLRQQQKQEVHTDEPKPESNGNAFVENAEKHLSIAFDFGAKSSKQHKQQRKKNNTATMDESVESREKLQIKLERIAQTTQQKFGSETAQNTSQHHLPLWELSEIIPTWMKEYFEWHKEKRQTLLEDFWNNENKNASNIGEIVSGPKFLVIQCLTRKTTFQARLKNESSLSCGSLSERLTLLPYWLRMACETNRLLFIYWTVPADLSRYLEPPVGGIDWRPPMWLKQMLEDDQQGILINDESEVLNNNSYLHTFESNSLLRVELKHSLDFEDKYNGIRSTNSEDARIFPLSSELSSDQSITAEKEPTFHQVFHDLWIIFFVPCSHILKSIYSAFRDNTGMSPGQYHSIDLSTTMAVTPTQFSSSYLEQDDGGSQLFLKEKRIFDCASRLPSEEAFFMVTDAINVTRALQEYVSAKSEGVQHNTSVFARYKPLSKWKTKQGIEQSKELLHQQLIDFDSDNIPLSSQETFYDIFVNLYLMAMGNCVVSYRPGIGGDNPITLSRLASLIGYDSNCYYQLNDGDLDQSSKSIESYCDGIVSDNFQPKVLHNREKLKIELHFCSPMITDGADDLGNMYKKSMPKIQHQQLFDVSNSFGKENLFPPWMEEYISWHRSSKRRLTRSNWKDFNYLILGCFEDTPSCGGISDRLKPLPMILWEAYQCQRLLLIWWERPKQLEEWLIPPNYDDGGIDWTVPVFLREEILRSQRKIRSGRDGSTVSKLGRAKEFCKGAIGKNAIVYHIQTADAGEKMYHDEQMLHANQSSINNSHSDSPITGSSYEDVYHRLFRIFFTPAPRLAGLLNSKLQQYNLVPGEYTAVHLRAMYGNRQDRDLQETLELAVLGVNCASNLFPGAPVYFASDTSFAVASAQAYGNLHSLPIVSLGFEHDFGISNSTASAHQASNPIHLDKDPDWKNRPASAYDSTFLDLYMLALSRCVAFSNGGYGTFGSLLSYESKCKMRFFKGRKKIKKCVWMNEKMKRQRLELPNVTDVVLGGIVK